MMRNTSKGHLANYKVGKGRPPTWTRWKPGQSGNPSGRKKGAKNFMTLIYEALNRKYTILENGKERIVTGFEAVALRTFNSALKGDMKTLAFILAIEPELERNAQEVKLIKDDMTPQEAADLYAQMIKK